MSRPHILHIIDSLSPGGSEKMAVEIANATDPKQYRVSVCVTRNDLTLKDNLCDRVGLLHLDRRHTFERAKFDQLNDFCVREQVNLLHIHGRYSFLLITLLSVLYPKIRSLPVVLHDHYGDVEINPSLPAGVRAAFWLKKPYYVGVHEKLTETAIQAGIAAGRARTIRNAIKFHVPETGISETPAWQANHPGPYGVMVANVRPSKDIQFLLQGLSKIKSLSWTVAVVGDFVDATYVRTCQALHRKLGLEGRVFFLGKRLDVSALLHQADFALLTSRTESGPLALLEYAAAGLPFVSTRAGSIGQLLASRGVPGFVEPGDVLSLTNAIKEVVELSQAERSTRGSFGREVAESFFDIQEAMRDWYQVYEITLGAWQ